MLKLGIVMLVVGVVGYVVTRKGQDESTLYVLLDKHRVLIIGATFITILLVYA